MQQCGLAEVLPHNILQNLRSLAPHWSQSMPACSLSNIPCPGDSLLFAAGAFCASGALQLGAVMATFITAAILGDAVNYTIGHTVGAQAVQGLGFPAAHSALCKLCALEAQMLLCLC